MEGQVTWTQAIWVVTMLSGATFGGFLAAWRIQVLRTHDQLTAVEQIAAIRAAFETRLSSIEVFNAGTMVVLKHMEEFRAEIKMQFEALRQERKKDMEGIHNRLNFMQNAERLRQIGLGDGGG